MIHMAIAQNIISIAASCVVQEEVPQNQGFKDPSFAKRMQATGWEKGDEWCAYFTKMVWEEAYARASQLAVVRKLASGGSLETYRNFASDTSGTFKVSKTVPVLGAIAIFQKGTTNKGHAGIVSLIDATGFKSIEENSNNTESTDGYEVAENHHLLNGPAASLHVYGFVYPVEAIIATLT